MKTRLETGNKKGKKEKYMILGNILKEKRKKG